MEHSYYQKWNSLNRNTHIKKWNPHQNGTLILSKGTLIKMEHSSKMEHSYYQKWNSLNRSKRNTHQNGTLILSKWNSLNRNTHIIALWCTYNFYGGKFEDPQRFASS